MAANRFFTILVIPEKTSGIKRLVVPSWILRGAVLGALFLGAVSIVMVLDYWYVMNQIDENKELKIENRRLRQEVQIFENRIATIENTMERVETFATRLRVITNIEDRDSLVQKLNQKLPDAATNIDSKASAESTTTGTLNSTSKNETPTAFGQGMDPQVSALKKDEQLLEGRFAKMNNDTLVVEQSLQDLYELLVDQKAFISALPTRKPAVGYFTSGFGIRRSPYGGIEKMHEGLDIANHTGTPIFAPSRGTITFAGRKPGYGKTICVDHGYGLETWYGHTSRILVKPGDKVRRGQNLGLMGTTGRSTGSHLHYEVRVHGIPVDPLSYILEN